MNHQPVHRQYLTERINKYLKLVSQKTGKHFTSHSFRIGLITALIDTTGISMACKIAGHSDIKTTELYNRSCPLFLFKDSSILIRKAAVTGIFCHFQQLP
jgi:site-specific recombinase XerD